MTTYTKEQFLADVKAEAKALRQHATKEELGRLNFEKLESRNFERCIYGQSTGNCFGNRAAELIFKCCPRYFKAEADTELGEEVPIETSSKKYESSFREYVNGEKPVGVNSAEGLYQNRNRTSTLHYSAIEAYIMYPFARNENLISYLRGETDDLNL